VEILLLNGADPNVKFNGFSAWQNCLNTETLNPATRVSLLKLLLLNGADANACFKTKTNGQQNALAVIQRWFDEFLAGNAQAAEWMMMRTASAVPAATLAQLKLDVIELKEMLIKAAAKDVHDKVQTKSSKMSGERVTLFVKRMLGRGRK
jgi:hypothetical protein